MNRRANATGGAADVYAPQAYHHDTSRHDSVRLLVQLLPADTAEELRRALAADGPVDRHRGEAHIWIDQTCSPLGRRRHRELANRRAFPAYKEGRRWRALLSDVEAYIRAHPTGGAPETPGGGADLRVQPATDAALHEDDAAVCAALAEAGLELVPPASSPRKGRR